jgi:hypothetical protein
MGVHTIDKEKLKKIFEQMAGSLKDDEELLPESIIKGSGDIWCYELTTRYIAKIGRGTKCYILDERKDNLGRILVYTVNNDVILIEEEDISYTGFN